MTESHSFEAILDIVRSINAPELHEERTVRWLGSKRLGVARDRAGAYELFLPGAQLTPASPLVAHHIHFDEWQDSHDTRFHANRLVLPNEPHFVPVAAFLVEELFRNGLSTDGFAPAFARSEPLIEMALRRLALSDQTLIGLIGELLLLKLFLVIAPSASVRGEVIGAWRGYERATHDFVLGNTMVEVKTTIGYVSQHEIQGVRQVDPSRGADGEPLEQLYLVSTGLRRATGDEEQGTTISLPQLVDEILELLSSGSQRNEIQATFLAKVRRYGGGTVQGYDHDSMSSWSAYRASFVQGFFRIYDMNDPAVAVLRHSDLVGRFVHPDSVSFSILLPDRVSGDVNPRTDIEAWATEALNVWQGKQTVSG